MAKDLLKKYKNCDKRRLSELFTGDETWVYYFEPQRRVNNKQWLRKDQARPIIAKRTEALQKFCRRYFSIVMGILLKFRFQNQNDHWPFLQEWCVVKSEETLRKA